MIAVSLQNMGLIRDFEVKEVARGSGLYRAWVRRDAESPLALITDVGFGISQVLPAIVLLYYAPEGSTVILEQPEIHLHPSVQASLADLIITAIKTRGLQVVLESHSEHLLQRLLRRIAEKTESPYPEFNADDVKLYFCTQDQGASQLNPLQLNLYGGIENWPKDFFGDALEDTVSREEAALRRRMAK
jgi:predicted ATPase